MDKSIVPVNQIAARSSSCYEFSNPNEAVVVELEDDPVEVVEKQMENLKLSYQFNEKDVPKVFQDLMKDNMNSFKEAFLHIHDQDCTMGFDEIEVRLEKRENDWIICYKNTDETITTDDPEKSINNHLWFVLKNPSIKLEFFRIDICEDQCSERHNQEIKYEHSQKLDFEKLNTLLQSMLNTISHQFYTNFFVCEGFNEDIFLSMLKHIDPKTLARIRFDIWWKKEGNYQTMEEIVGTDQWKQAKTIFSFGITPLKIDDILHCEYCVLTLDKIEPETGIQTKEKFIKSTNCNTCILASQNEDLDINAYRMVLLPDSFSENSAYTEFTGSITYTYELPNSPNHLWVTLHKRNIHFKKIPRFF